MPPVPPRSVAPRRIVIPVAGKTEGGSYGVQRQRKCSDKGYSFDLTNGENVLMSAMQLPVPSRCGLAVANAKLVKPQMGGG